MTDGTVPNEDAIISLVRSHVSTTKCFVIGITPSVSLTLVNGLAKAGNGEAEFIGAESNSFKQVVQLQFKRTFQPALTNVILEWDKSKHEGLAILQVPEKLPPIFAHNKYVVYCFFSKTCSMKAKLCVDTPEGQKKFSMFVDSSNLSKGNSLQTIGASKRIEELEMQNLVERSESLQKEIVSLCQVYNLLSSVCDYWVEEKTFEYDGLYEINKYQVASEQFKDDNLTDYLENYKYDPSNDEALKKEEEERVKNLSSSPSTTINREFRWDPKSWSRPVKQGMLKKKGGWNFKNRWFIVQGSRMFYFKTDLVKSKKNLLFPHFC